jgi:putative cell wall-binding protein
MLKKTTHKKFSAILATSVALSLMLASVPAGAATAPEERVRPTGGTQAAAPVRTAGSGLRTLAADDNIPGVALPTSPVSGTLSATSDFDDVFAVTLGVGDTLTAAITGPSGSYFDLFLYAPGSTNVDTDEIIFGTDSPDRDFAYPFTMDFKVDPAQGYAAGTYYLDAYAIDGSGTYTITYRIIPADNNDDIPGEPLPSSPFTRWNTSAWLYPHPDSSAWGTFVDMFDVYSIALAEGDQFTATVSSTDKDLDMELLFYPPTASMVDTDGAVAAADAWVAATDISRAGMPETFNFVVPPGGAGTYYLSAEAWGGSGDYKVTWSIDQSNIVRMQGPNRYETGQAIVRSTTVSSKYAIIASGANYPDALSAAGLAGVYEAPLLLTNPTGLSDTVAVQLVEMGVSDVIVIGGTAAVSGKVVTALQNMGFSSVERIYGADRYETSAKCADRVAQIAGSVPRAFVVRGDSFPDALAVSPFAYTQKMPVLLTKPTSLPSSIRTFLDTKNVAEVYIAGGTPSVSSSVKATIESLNEATTTADRIAGVDRYQTARLVADYGVAEGWGTYGFVGVATGTNFPDALAGGVGCGRMGGVLLLTRPTALSTQCQYAITANAGTIDRVAVFGSSAAVGTAVYNAIKALLIP